MSSSHSRNNSVPLIVSIPHSGEQIPPQATWLKDLPEEVLMCDVDRFVDVLYTPAMTQLAIPHITTQWHRYAADLNRLPDDVDAASVVGHPNPVGTYSRGFHWEITTYKHQLIKQPMSVKIHDELVDLVYKPFHAGVRALFEEQRKKGYQKVYHIDAHSMPSVGTSEHRDPGERRADIVVSDQIGKSCDPKFKDLVIAAYATAGFKVGYNWPYFGGRVTEQYGQPVLGQHTIQVEMNRSLYMNEVTKKLNTQTLSEVQQKVALALQYIKKNLPEIM